ncbi:hypothetical protein [Novosphingobium sp. PhB57]|jgi:hypothetical protein|uniref:hypothetical protein n=1 Tax=Novosphingobium sp. PhB57 TaxID=2485107 RepID=UPI001FB22D86|nr:hypothetical protein [Novosphingobium sp. PhB57]
MTMQIPTSLLIMTMPPPPTMCAAAIDAADVHCQHDVQFIGRHRLERVHAKQAAFDENDLFETIDEASNGCSDRGRVFAIGANCQCLAALRGDRLGQRPGLFFAIDVSKANGITVLRQSFDGSSADAA